MPRFRKTRDEPVLRPATGGRKSGSPRAETLKPGQIRQLRLLGTLATYTVVAVQGELARVRVREAPGLPPNMQLTMTCQALASMQLVDSFEVSQTSQPQRRTHQHPGGEHHARARLRQHN